MKKNKLGFKFFWTYLILGAFSAYGNFNYYFDAYLESNNIANMIYNGYATLMCFSFIIAAILFILSTLFVWKTVYLIAYYIHVFFLGLCFVERIIHMIASCYYGRFFVIPVCLGYMGLIILDFLYFKNRKYIFYNTEVVRVIKYDRHKVKKYILPVNKLNPNYINYLDNDDVLHLYVDESGKTMMTSKENWERIVSNKETKKASKI